MDRDLLRQSLGCHGPALLSLLRSEQQDNPHFRSLLGTAAEPARGAAPPQGAGRYGAVTWAGRDAGQGGVQQSRVAPGGETRGAPSDPFWRSFQSLPRPHFQVGTLGERTGFKLLPELSG